MHFVFLVGKNMEVNVDLLFEMDGSISKSFFEIKIPFFQEPISAPLRPAVSQPLRQFQISGLRAVRQTSTELKTVPGIQSLWKIR